MSDSTDVIIEHYTDVIDTIRLRLTVFSIGEVLLVIKDY